MKVACTVLNGESGSNAADLHNKALVDEDGGLSPIETDENRLALPTKGVALAVIAKTRILAASPLYNGGYAEALTLVNNDGKRLFPDADPNKWKIAKVPMFKIGSVG